VDPLDNPHDLDTVVAGLSCREVLHRLTDFLDDDLPPDELPRVTAHLAACRTCEAFGGRVGSLIVALRMAEEQTSSLLPPGAADRLRSRLAAERR